MSTYRKYNAVSDQAAFNKKMKLLEDNRQCLKCEKLFPSKSKQNRLCEKCRERIKENGW